MSTSYRVFVATDLSAPADEAIRQADERARARSGELLVCHVIPNIERINPLFPHLNQRIYTDLSALRERAFNALTQRVVDVTGRSPTEFAILLDEGIAHAAIVEQAEQWGADVLVVAGQGGSGLFGGVVQKVVRYAHCPVLVARPRSARGRILVATDFSDAALPAIAAAGEEARATGARVTAMHAVDVGISTAGEMSAALGSPYPGIPPDVHVTLLRMARTMLDNALVQFGIDGDCHVVEGAPAQAIERAAIELEPELLVLGTAGRTGLRRVLLGSVAERVVQHTTCPVLVVRLGAAAES